MELKDYSLIMVSVGCGHGNVFNLAFLLPFLEPTEEQINEGIKNTMVDIDEPLLLAYTVSTADQHVSMPLNLLDDDEDCDHEDDDEEIGH